MRRFEFIDGKSSKFWEITVSNEELTVNYGRIGTQGQSKTKAFASEAAAQAEAAKLIREKTGKGYAKVGGNPDTDTDAGKPAAPQASRSAPPRATAAPAAPASQASPATQALQSDTSAPPAPAPDNEPPTVHDTADGLAWPSAGFVWTEAWRARLPVVRGVRVEPGLMGAGNLDKLPFEGDPRHCTDLKTWQQSLPAEDGLGQGLYPLVKAAAALHGVPFALELLLHTAADWRENEHLKYSFGLSRPARWLRKYIAACSDADHGRCVAVAERFRGADIYGDSLICHLFPEQGAWAEACAADPEVQEDTDILALLYDTALSPETLLRILRGRYGEAFGWDGSRHSPGPILLQLQLHGVAALPLFEAAIKQYTRQYSYFLPALEHLLQLLEQLEAPEVFPLLFRHVEAAPVRELLQRLAARWPAALFKTALLTPRRSDALEDWAVRLGVERPDIIDTVLAASTPGERARLESVVRQRLRPVEADSARLPQALRQAPADLPAAKGKKPLLPDFFQAPNLRRPLLRAELGGGALPLAAMEILGRLLAASTLEAPRPELAEVRAACTPESLADFAWSLFCAWQVAGSPSKQSWAFSALGLLGNAGTAYKLAPLIRLWPGQSAHARATLGLDILAALGSDAALMQLNAIAEKVKHAGLQARARERIDHIALARGLSPTELSDRLVPDLGLDEQGSVWLDFGPRQFRVQLDEALKPRLFDASGKMLKDLPKPGRQDETELAEAAVAQFKALKKEAKAVAALHIPRLERAMAAQRRWQPEVFQMLFIHHPLLRQLARRLLWGVYRDGVATDAFRVAEDGTLADRNDETYALPAPDSGAEIGIAHPLELAPELLGAFGLRFAEYEIMQPFRQLGRETYVVDEAEHRAGELLRFKDKMVHSGALMGLSARDWEQEEGGYSIRCFTKALANGEQVGLELEPGILLGELAAEPEQTLVRLDLPSTQASPVWVSELIRDIELLSPR